MKAKIILTYLKGIETRMTKVEDVTVNTTSVEESVDIERKKMMKGDVDTRRTMKEGTDMRKKVRGDIDTKKMMKDVTGMKTKKRGAGDTRAGVETKKYLLSKLEMTITIQTKNSEDHKTETERSRAIGVENPITQDSLTKAARLLVVLLGNITKKRTHL